MYSPLIIQERMNAVEQDLGFEPQYHSMEKCRRGVEHLDSIRDPQTGKLLRKLKSDEVRWIKNERAVCQIDFLYWAQNYAWVKDDQNRATRFKPRIAQLVFLDVLSDLQDEERAIALQVLKARQLGVSTVAELCVAHRVQFYNFVNAIAGSSDPDKSRIMVGMMEFCWDFQPWWLMPERTASRSGEYIEFGKMGSAVSIAHGNQFSGIGRGTTPTVAHLSEICDYDDPASLIDAGLLKAMHESPWMFAVLESTANGMHNWWHKTWEASVEGWKTKTSRLCPLFLPWFVGRDLYPTETWIKSRPIPHKWEPGDLTKAHARRAQDYVRRNDVLRKHLGDLWVMPKEQMWYWEVNRTEALRKGTLGDFYSEMPADDTEAFQNKNTSVFAVDVMSELREQTQDPKAVFSVVTDEMPERLRPAVREIDHSIKPIVLSVPLAGGKKFRADLIPLRFQGYSGYDFTNKLFIWEWPEEGNEYGMGVDTADGLDLDRSVIQVLRKGTVESNDFQAAEWASGLVNAFDIPPICFAIASVFSTIVNGEYKPAKVVIETNRTGEATQLEMRKMGWKNFHVPIHYDNKKISPRRSNKLGWSTNTRTRPLMMDNFITYIKDNMVDINSPYLVKELAQLERSATQQKIQAMFGGHDDRVTSMASVLYSLHDLEHVGTRRNLMKLRMEDKFSPIVFAGPPVAYQNRDLDEAQLDKLNIYRPGDEDEEPDYDPRLVRWGQETE